MNFDVKKYLFGINTSEVGIVCMCFLVMALLYLFVCEKKAVNFHIKKISARQNLRQADIG